MLISPTFSLKPHQNLEREGEWERERGRERGREGGSESESERERIERERGCGAFVAEWDMWWIESAEGGAHPESPKP